MSGVPFRQLPHEPEARVRCFWLTAEDGVRLRAGHWPSDQGKGTVLLMQGRTEYLEKYRFFARDLVAAGYDVLSLDWRGQGLSGRLQENLRLSHVPAFEDYQRDVVEMLATAQELDLPRPWHLLAHPMGGAIGLAALNDGLPVETATFSAPMWGINFNRPMHLFAMALTTSARKLGLGTRVVPGAGGEECFILHSGFRENRLTTDCLEWGRLVAETELWPELVLGGVTHDWLHTVLHECKRLEALPSPQVPALIAYGTRENIVSAGAIRKRAENWPGAELLTFQGGKHEPMMEIASIRREFLDALLSHFRASA